ncbi:MAG: hypothetical protein Q7K43_03530 [Candidatus Woesearchaeota archaeon]|nr:hypothetical protein [Candidatus Woesearchaeota archaeon]
MQFKVQSMIMNKSATFIKRMLSALSLKNLTDKLNALDDIISGKLNNIIDSFIIRKERLPFIKRMLKALPLIALVSIILWASMSLSFAIISLIVFCVLLNTPEILAWLDK